MENPMNKWMIWGYHIFGNTHIIICKVIDLFEGSVLGVFNVRKRQNAEFLEPKIGDAAAEVDCNL